MGRSILLRWNDSQSAIDGYTCSRCGWWYRIEQPTTHDLNEKDTRRACQAFLTHQCVKYARPREQWASYS
jgi:rubredoxin